MSNEFSSFATFNSIDPLYSTLDTALQQSNLVFLCFFRPELKKILHGTVEFGSMTVVSNV